MTIRHLLVLDYQVVPGGCQGKGGGSGGLELLLYPGFTCYAAGWSRRGEGFHQL
jgi:hypothetical protein